MNFIESVQKMKVEDNSVAISWIGQAGFILKTSQGKLIAIDPYLSDCVYRLLKDIHGLGFKRLMPALFNPEEIAFDYIFCSHEHPDHLDIDSVNAFLSNGKTKLLGNEASIEMVKKINSSGNQLLTLKRGDVMQCEEFKLYVTDADHGEEAKEALGFVFDLGFVKVYFSGDTCYNKNALKKVIDLKPEVALLPINGAFGNLDARAASHLAADLGSRLCIPCHFWTFPMHLGNPQEAIGQFEKNAPGCELLLMYQGETFIYQAGNTEVR